MQLIFKGERGSLLMVTLIALIVLSIMGFAFLSKSNTDLKASGNSKRKMDVNYTAESAVNRVALNLQNFIERNKNIYTVHGTPVNASGVSVDLREPSVSVYARPTFKTDCESLNASVDLSGTVPLRDITYACDWMADRYELSQDLDTISEDHKVEIIKIDVDTDQDMTSTVKIPHQSAAQFSNLIANRRVYLFEIKAQPESKTTSTTYQVRLAAYQLPVFQYLMLHDKPITMLPGGRNDRRGRIHSNTAIRAGTLGGPLSFFPESFDTKLDLSLTTSGSIFHIFQYSNGSSTWDYIDDWAGGESKSVRVVTDDNNTPNDITDDDYARFNDHIEPVTYPTDAFGYPSNPAVDCGTDPFTDICWYDDQTSTTGYEFWGMKVDANHADFEGRIESDTRPVKPGWYKDIEKYNASNDPSDPDYSFSDILQPYDNNSTGNPDNTMIKNVKKFYASDLRIIINSDGSLTSVDADNNPILGGPKSIGELTSRLIIKTSSTGNYDFYHPTAGKKARVIKLDIQHLREEMAANTDYDDIDHIYFGSVDGAAGKGEWHYPSENCGATSGSPSGGFAEICVDENGVDCTSTCDPTKLGHFDVVQIQRAQELPRDLTISSNTMVAVQGNYNTVNNPATGEIYSSAIYSDSLQLLSNSWNPYNHYDPVSNPTATTGWNPGSSIGSPPASTTTYNFAYSTGIELPLIEDWSGDYIYRGMSEVIMHDSKQYPPRWGNADNEAIHDWLYRAWSFFYRPGTWRNSQNMVFANIPPPDSEKAYYAYVLSIEEVENTDK